MIRHAFSLILLFSLQTLTSAQPTLSPESGKSAETNTSDVQLLLRIPALLIAKSVNRDFEHVGPVNQVLLGTTSTGTSHCTGRVSCLVEDNPNGVSIVCCISGKVESITCGTNGPAIIHSTTTTQYQASKKLSFDGKTFGCSPASVTSTTNLTITGIGSSLPRLGGRLVKRVATKRAHDSHAQVEAIVGSQTEAELRHRIDADFEARIAGLNTQFESKLSILHRFPGAERHLRLCSANDGVEVVLGRSSDNGLEKQEIRKPIGEFVELWLRRSENLVAGGLVAGMFFSKAPVWLSTYFSENPMFLKPDDRKWGFEVQEKWIVVSLHE